MYIADDTAMMIAPFICKTTSALLVPWPKYPHSFNIAEVLGHKEVFDLPTITKPREEMRVGDVITGTSGRGPTVYICLYDYADIVQDCYIQLSSKGIHIAGSTWNPNTIPWVGNLHDNLDTILELTSAGKHDEGEG